MAATMPAEVVPDAGAAIMAPTDDPQAIAEDPDGPDSGAVVEMPPRVPVAPPVAPPAAPPVDTLATPVPVPPPAVATLPADSALAQQLDAFAREASLPQAERDQISAFYAQNGGGPVWVAGDRPSSEAAETIALLAAAHNVALDPQRYRPGDLATLSGEAGSAALMRFELAMTRAALRYVADRTGARLASLNLSPEIEVPALAPDAPGLLRQAANAPNGDISGALAALGPQDGNFRGLLATLDAYRTLAAQGGWAVIPLRDRDKIEPGQMDDRMPIVRARLAVTDGAPIVAAGDPSHYDPDLVMAVERFQVRHGLKPDGVMGRNTLKAMNRTVEERIAQLEVAIERARATRADLGPSFIQVNIPEYKLRLVKDGTLVWETNVVVGSTRRKTPLITSRMQTVIFRPTWTVPVKLAGQDIVPKVLRNPNYLAEHGFRIYDGWAADAQEIDPTLIDWTTVSRTRFPYRLRQDPGLANSLGQVKLMFANSHSVYLHDTPDRHLLSRDVRAYSSGCVRVQDPLRLSEFLLERNGNWDRARIDQTVATGGSPVSVGVRDSIAIQFIYVTAWMGTDNQIQFRDDIYGTDARIDTALKREGARLVADAT
ncbi:L,D-transpeptidase family protein [Zavarzinia sp. CC-PAN008]|uniref:L,D-transpeptidase family protein n=1 Tax=Zavarzinia sp. CC-PAN008 TaxID=3243332 RepID=UPI003F748CFD